MWENYCDTHWYSSFVVLQEEEKELYDTENLVHVTWEKHSKGDIVRFFSYLFTFKGKKREKERNLNVKMLTDNLGNQAKSLTNFLIH